MTLANCLTSVPQCPHLQKKGNIAHRGVTKEERHVLQVPSSEQVFERQYCITYIHELLRKHQFTHTDEKAHVPGQGLKVVMQEDRHS